MDKELEKAIIIFKNLDMGNDTEFIKARKVIVEELENSVSKDKIREKIEKLNKNRDMISGGYAISILQGLLEGE